MLELIKGPVLCLWCAVHLRSYPWPDGWRLWVSVCTKWSLQNILLPSGSIKVLKVLFSETDFLHRPVMFHSHAWIQWRKNNTSNDLPFLRRNCHSSWIFCAPHTAPWAFLRGLLSNYSPSSTCLAHEIWQNHSLMWSSWDLTLIYKN